MLLSLVALARAETACSIPATHGEAMQREFFRRIGTLDPDGAARLHGEEDGSLRPYTISAIRPERRRFRGGRLQLLAGESCWFRLTALDSATSQALLALADSVNDWKLSARGFSASLAIDRWVSEPDHHPWAGWVTQESLTEEAARSAESCPDRLSLHFASPTAFARNSDSGWASSVHLPLPDLVFGSLWKKWTSFSAASPWAYPGRDRLQRQVALGRFQLDTSMMCFEMHRRRCAGFQGACEFLLGPGLDSHERAWLHLMSAFAFYSGAGACASWGMGQVHQVRDPITDGFCKHEAASDSRLLRLPSTPRSLSLP